jgi:hypothetical protein
MNLFLAVFEDLNLLSIPAKAREGPYFYMVVLVELLNLTESNRLHS